MKYCKITLEEAKVAFDNFKREAFQRAVEDINRKLMVGCNPAYITICSLNREQIDVLIKDVKESGFKVDEIGYELVISF